jgi:3-oxoacid CoA-transferase A subunit
MGTLAERYRAAAAGVAAVYLPTGTGSIVEKSVVSSIVANRTPKETRTFNGKTYILGYALKPDFAFVHAHTGDTEGNLRYAKTARNFNPVMASAAKITIAEVENLVQPGEIDPDSIHTPGIYVKRVVPVSRIQVRVGID